MKTLLSSLLLILVIFSNCVFAVPQARQSSQSLTMTLINNTNSNVGYGSDRTGSVGTSLGSGSHIIHIAKWPVPSTQSFKFDLAIAVPSGVQLLCPHQINCACVGEIITVEKQQIPGGYLCKLSGIVPTSCANPYGNNCPEK
jgi:hypothetical protein